MLSYTGAARTRLPRAPVAYLGQGKTRSMVAYTHSSASGGQGTP
jgi:hypothetical protein